MKNVSLIGSGRFVSVIGRQVFVQEKSLDSPVTIIFIHGRCLSVQSWKRQFESELLAPFGLVAFDLLGHGLSERASDRSEYSLSGSVRLLSALIDELQLTNFIIVGHSLGGHIGLQALPNLAGCRGVFCMTMPLIKPAEFDKMYYHGSLLMQVYQPNPDPERLDAYVGYLFQPQPNELPSFVKEDFWRTDPVVHDGLVQGIVAGSYQDEMDSIRTTGLPIAIVQGQLEQLHNLAYLSSLGQSVWRNKPQLVPLAGHMLQWENPGYVNQLIHDFLTDIG